MAAAHNQFTWYDLMTTDSADAAAFYRAVVGWEAADAGLPDRRYLTLTAGSAPVGGIIDLPEPARAGGALPSWNGYIGVADVDSMAGRVVEKGGVVHRAPDDIPGVGRFAIVSDPQGAAFSLFTPLDDSPPPAAPPGLPGHVGWHELRAADGPAAFDFYADLFGWTKADAIDMGPMGVYQIFAIGGTGVGGMLTRMDASMPPAWLYYVNVDGIDAAAARVREARGQILDGPHQVPGGSWIVHGLDRQGAAFALVSAGR